MTRRGAFLEYLKAAFLWRWNLLAAGAGVIFALLSGRPDLVLPLIGAGEIIYLGLLTTNERFRKAIDARAFMRMPQPDQKELLTQIQSVVKPEAWARFDRLRERCLTLSKISEQFRGPQAAGSPVVTDLQTSSLERLLWIFLKLLYSQDALRRFLNTTDRDGLVQEIEATEKALESAEEKARGEKLISSLKDKLETLGQRLENYDRAAENREFLAIEIDRIEQKVNAIGEMALNSRDAADISAQVNGIAEGVSATEEAMRSLEVAPVLQREEVPRLLDMR